MKQVYRCRLINVIDGDTIDLYVNLGLGFFVNARIRLQGIDAPEIYHISKNTSEYHQGIVAKYTVARWLHGYEKDLYLRAEERGLYGRWLGEVWRKVGEESLNDYLITRYYKSQYKDWKHQRPLLKNYFDNGSL